jgi:3-carboxy-cis,cis-muconate cycloisomerase
LTSSADEPTAAPSLLAPVVAGTPVERLTDDQAFLDAMVATEAALAQACADNGVIDRASAAVVVTACGELKPNPRDLALRATTGGNPLIPLVADLRERVAVDHPDAARAVHHGATSQDIVDTALMLLARRALVQTDADLRDSAGAAARLADSYRATPACGRTLGQQALPTTFGLRAAGWLTGIVEAIERVESVAAALPVQLGGPVGSTTAYGERGPEVVAALAARLGLVTPVAPWHTRRTPVVDVGHAAVVTTGALAKVATDVMVLSQSEVGEVAEASGGGSSSMAHKANPVQSVLIATAARQVPALVGVLGASMAAEQERATGAWHAEWEPLRQALRLCGAAAHRGAALLADLRVDTDAMQRNLDHLVDTAGLDEQAVPQAQAAATPWIDRALAAYEDTRGSRT